MILSDPCTLSKYNIKKWSHLHLLLNVPDDGKSCYLNSVETPNTIESEEAK